VPDWGNRIATYAYRAGIKVDVSREHALFDPDRLVTCTFCANFSDALHTGANMNLVRTWRKVVSHTPGGKWGLTRPEKSGVSHARRKVGL
jgi:hypothetical protein